MSMPKKVPSQLRTVVHNTGGRGACCTQITVVLRGEIIDSVIFTGGCPGNHRAIETLVAGQRAADVAERLAGIGCQNGTSCPDQLAQALRAALSQAT